MTDNLSNLFVALNKQAASRIAGVSRKNKRDDAKHAPATHSEIFDATFKNYAGRHDQQMHTTLFNLANPSQDRAGEGTRETFAKESGSEAGFAALIATLNAKIDPITAEAWMAAHTASISAQQLWQQDISKMVVEISKEISAKGITAVEHGSNLWVLHNKLNYSTQPAGNLAAFGATASDQLANWNRAQAEIKTGLEAVKKLLKQFPNDASIKALYSQIQNRYVTFRATQLLMLRESWEHSDAANKYSQFASHAVLPGYTRTGLERINWDGATDAPASRDGVVAAKGIKEKSVAEGASTVREISRIAIEMGIPSGFLKFATSQTGVNRTTVAQYAPSTNEITIFPHLVNGKTNTNVQLRAVMAHEVTHHQYEVISLAAKYSNAPTSPNSMQTAQVSVTFGSKVQKDLQTRDFIGTPYERKLLQALTNPKSVMNIDAKTGFVTPKRGFETFVELFKADGVSAYSAKYWRDFSIYPSQQALRRAINETLSEAAYLRTAGQAKTIQKGWLEASRLFESLYGKLGTPYVGFDLDAGYKELGSANPVAYKKTQVFEALKEVSARYTPPAPPKYTSKSMQKLVGKTGWIIPLLFVGQHGKSENAPKINDAHDTYGSEMGNAQNNKHLQKYTSKALQNLLGQDVLYSSILIRQALKQRKTGAASPRNVAAINNYTDGHTLITAFKNHPGSHMEETHTTNFNLANPSQGREGRKRDKTDEVRASATDAPSKSLGEIPRLSQLTETGTTLGGSTGASLMVDKDGNRYIVKRGASPEHIASEAATYDLYRAAGVPVPQTSFQTYKDGPVLVSRFIEGRPLGSLSGKELDDAITKINKHFVVDALLANWDTVGMSRDNIIIGKDGVPYRIDVGGSLSFRAQGGPKEFGDKVGEIDTLRTSRDGAPIFGKLSDKQVADQILALHNRPAMRLTEHANPISREYSNVDQSSKAEKLFLAAERIPSNISERIEQTQYALANSIVNRLDNLTLWAHQIKNGDGNFGAAYKSYLGAPDTDTRVVGFRSYIGAESGPVNKSLRTKTTDFMGEEDKQKAQRIARGMDELVASLSTALPPVLYRGVRDTSADSLGLKVGQTNTDLAYGSTSASRQFTKGWASRAIKGFGISEDTITKDKQGVHFIIVGNPKRGFKGLDVQFLKERKVQHMNEAEFILPRGTVTKVMKIVKGSWGDPKIHENTEPDRVYLRIVSTPLSPEEGGSTTTKNYRGRKTLTMAFKNHPGTHDEQTHTTLFNLANPSQGREGSNRNKTGAAPEKAYISTNSSDYMSTKTPAKVKSPAPAPAAAPVAAPATAPAPIKQVSTGVMPSLFSQLTETGTTLGGSTGAKLMVDKDGNRYVVKRGASPEHITSESLAYSLYRAAGVPVPQTKVLVSEDGPVLVSRFIEGRPLGSLRGKELDDAITKINKHFVVDALLGNWDAVGMSRDNIIIGKDGVPYRIDVGGSLAYRAQGGTKEFGAKVGEIDTLRTSRDGAPIFGKLSDKQVGEQILALHNRPAMRAIAHTDPSGLGEPNTRAEQIWKESKNSYVGDAMVSRLNSLLAQAHDMLQDKSFSQPFKEFHANKNGIKYESLQNYVADSTAVNQYLRKGDGLEFYASATGRTLEGIDRLMASPLATPLPPVLYRGIGGSSAAKMGYKVGDTVTDKAFGSTTTKRGFAKSWATTMIGGLSSGTATTGLSPKALALAISRSSAPKDEQGIVFTIISPPKLKATGLDVQLLQKQKHYSTGEAEHITPRGMVYKVVKIVKGSWGTPGQDTHTEPDRVYLRLVKLPDTSAAGDGTTTKNYRGRKTLIMAFKNHPGSHDEQTHTTLFNLANPSQGREGGKQNKTEPLKATAAPEAASVAPTPIKKVSTSEMPRLFSRLNETGVTLGGSSGAKLMVDQDGNRYVVKRGNSETTEARMRAEAVAYDIYRAAGVPVPQTVVLETDTGPVLVSRFIEGRPLSSLSGKELDDAITKINKHFAVDALLNNWDAIGATLNNIIVGKDGVPYRIDVSSSLALKSKDGSVKPLSLRPTEIDTLRKPKYGASIYEKLSDEQVAEQILALHNRPAMRTKAHKRPWNDDEPLTRAEKMMKAGRNPFVASEFPDRLNNLLVWAHDKLQAQSFSKPYRVFGLPDTDTIKQSEALTDYVVNSYALNDHLRGKLQPAPSYALVMKDGLDKLMASPLATRLPPVLYRGVPGSSAAKLGFNVGDTVKDSAFGSTTTKRGFAKAWATSTVGGLERSVPPDAQGVVFTIISPPKLKATGLDVQLLQKVKISTSPLDEGEHITPRGMTYKVVKIVKGSWGRPGIDEASEPDRVYLRLVKLPDTSAAD